MNPIDRFRTRVAEAFGSMILTLVATVGGIVIQSAQEATPPTEPATSISIGLLTGLMTSLPGIVSFLGVIGATLIAGPLGFVGALLEVAGANQLLYNQSTSGFWMIVFGAGLVAIGAPIPWMKVLEWFLDSGGRY
jgi:low affinity Fe/Cu permease